MQLVLFKNFLEIPLGETQFWPPIHEQVAIRFSQEMYHVKTPLIYKPLFSVESATIKLQDIFMSYLRMSSNMVVPLCI